MLNRQAPGLGKHLVLSIADRLHFLLRAVLAEAGAVRVSVVSRNIVSIVINRTPTTRIGRVNYLFRGVITLNVGGL